MTRYPSDSARGGEGLTYPDRLRVMAAHNPALSDDLMWIADEIEAALATAPAHAEKDALKRQKEKG